MLPSFTGLTSFDSLVFIFISVCFPVCGFFGCFSQCPVSNTFPRHLFMLFLNFHSSFSEYCWRTAAQQSFGLSSALPVLFLLPNGLFNHLGHVFFFLMSLLPGLLFILGFMCLFFYFPRLFCFLRICSWSRPLPLTCESLSLKFLQLSFIYSFLDRLSWMTPSLVAKFLFRSHLEVCGSSHLNCFSV